MADLPGIDQDLTFSKEIAAQMLEYKAHRYIDTYIAGVDCSSFFVCLILSVRNDTSAHYNSLLWSFAQCPTEGTPCVTRG